MMDKGTCLKHGEFILTEGCPQCIAERRQEPKEKKILCMSEEGCEHQKGAYCEGGDPDCLFAEGNFTGNIPPSLGSTTAQPVDEVAIPVEIPTAIVKVKPEQDIEVQSFYEQALKLKEYAEQRVITTVGDLKPATDDLSIIAKVKKALEEKRKEYLGPFRDHIEEINDAFKRLMEPILIADIVTREKMLAFDAEQKQIRQEQERINAMRLEAAQAEMELKGELSESVNLVEVVPEAPKRISTDMGTSGQTDHWKYEVVDFAQLPDEYKVADSAMLNAVAKKHHDQKQIPGVRFYNEPYIAMRLK